MSKKPNYKLFREAVAIVMGIPERQFDLNAVMYTPGETRSSAHSCGSVGCAIGWLGLHPKFQALGLDSSGNFNTLNFKGEPEDYSGAAVKLFGMTLGDANRTFGPATFSSANVGYEGQLHDHKAMLMHRAQRWLREQGQPTND